MMITVTHRLIVSERFLRSRMLSTRNLIRPSLNTRRPFNCLLCIRLFHKTPTSWLPKASNVVYNKGEALLRNSYKRLTGAIQAFDDLLGISEVQEAQSNVKRAENEFMKTRSQVQDAKRSLDSVQESLREIRQKLDRVSRDDERYLALATEEHKLLLQEKKMKSDFENLESLERDQFAQLSGSVRDSHEKERARAERTKHWSVIGSVGGAALGILGSTVVNYIRLKQIKTSIKETGHTLIEKTNELRDLMTAQDDQMGTRATELKESILIRSKSLEQKLEELESILNFVTLNLASEPLKEFGLYVQPPSHSKNFGNGQSLAVDNNKEDVKDVIDTIVLRIDSLVESIESVQKVMQGLDLKTLLWNHEKLNNSIHQNEARIVEEIRKLSTSLKYQPPHVNGVTENATESNFEENQSWMKVSLTCIALTATVLIYDIIK
ncbi:mitochondrial potassium channel-like [Montipora foliosa]|uniref:mitochondrial potassium channel-like n=1 Tax=Montipora foliosa TaxID=591990 RepID=UPI0035F17D2C